MEKREKRIQKVKKKWKVVVGVIRKTKAPLGFFSGPFNLSDRGMVINHLEYAVKLTRRSLIARDKTSEKDEKKKLRKRKNVAKS